MMSSSSGVSSSGASCRAALSIYLFVQLGSTIYFVIVSTISTISSSSALSLCFSSGRRYPRRQLVLTISSSSARTDDTSSARTDDILVVDQQTAFRRATLSIFLSRVDGAFHLSARSDGAFHLSACIDDISLLSACSSPPAPS